MTQPLSRSKYRAIKTHCSNSHLHDSRLEAGRCDDLHALQAAGQIERLTLQPEFICAVDGRLICKYVGDFAYFVADCRIVEDVKGMRTAAFNLKKKIVEAIHPGVVITLWPVRKRKQRKTKKK